MVVVSDTSPLRVLAFLDLLPLLGQEFDRVLVPPLVQSELLQEKPHLPAVDVLRLPFVEVREPKESRLPPTRNLHAPERQALDLALELGCKAVLVDEAVGRATAIKLGLLPIGALRLVVRAKHRGAVSEVGPIIDRLRREARFFIDDRLRRRILVLAGEEPGDA